MKLNFSNPLYVSTFEGNDYLNLKILNKHLFMAKTDKFLIEDKYSLVRIDVSTQMASEEDYKSISSQGSNA